MFSAFPGAHRTAFVAFGRTWPRDPAPLSPRLQRPLPVGNFSVLAALPMFSTIHSRGKDLSPKRGLFGNVRIRLKTAGFRDSTPPNAHPHRRRVYFYDPEGNDWEFVHTTPKILPSEMTTTCLICRLTHRTKHPPNRGTA